MMMRLHIFRNTALMLGLLTGMTLLVGGCGEQPSAAQSTGEHGHEHGEVSESGGHGGHGHDEAAGEHEDDQGHDAHDAHNAHDEQQVLQLSDEELAEFDIELQSAEAGTLSLALSLPGEVVFDPDRVVHVTPRVPGVVRQVNQRIGDRVEAGEVLAVLDSRELAQAKSACLAAQAKLDMAKANFDREQRLFEQQIAPEAEFLEARQALRGAEVDLQLAERELHALGLNKQQVADLPGQGETTLTRYELTAPIAGTIIERHLTRGEVIPAQPSDPPFVIADVETVWVELTVYPRNLDRVQPGQVVTIAAENTQTSTTGTIDYISPQVRESTRTATARVVLKNADGAWRPGQFVTGRVQVEQVEAKVIIPESAVHIVKQEPVVFVQTGTGFEPRAVEIGRRGEGRVEIISGLEPGQRYAATNTFILKAELDRGQLEHAGHAH